MQETTTSSTTQSGEIGEDQGQREGWWFGSARETRLLLEGAELGTRAVTTSYIVDPQPSDQATRPIHVHPGAAGALIDSTKRVAL